MIPNDHDVVDSPHAKRVSKIALWTQTLDTLVIALYVKIARVPRRTPKLSHAELICLAWVRRSGIPGMIGSTGAERSSA